MLTVMMIGGPILIVLIIAGGVIRCCIKRRLLKQKARDQAKKLNVTLQKLEDSPMTKRHPSFSSSQHKGAIPLEYKLSNNSYQCANDHDYSDGNSVDSSYYNSYYYPHSANGCARDTSYRLSQASSPNHYPRPHQQTGHLTPNHSPVYRVCRTPPSIPGSPRHYAPTSISNTYRPPPAGSGSRYQTYHMVVGSDMEESGSISATV